MFHPSCSIGECFYTHERRPHAIPFSGNALEVHAVGAVTGVLPGDAGEQVGDGSPDQRAILRCYLFINGVCRHPDFVANAHAGRGECDMKDMAAVIIDDTTIAGTVTLTAAKAAKMGSK